jgi:hypothetical protein
MLGITSYAGIKENIFTGGSALMREPWGLATLGDAYCGFLTFYAWVFYRERSAVSRIFWLVFILLFGNIAMSLYMLILLYKMPKDAKIESVLLKRTAQ